MNLAAPGADRDANTDLRRLLDAGYEVRLTLAPDHVGYSADAPGYMATITSGMGSDWRGFGRSPAEAVQSVWPLGYGDGQGGCGHCDGMGCIVPGCRTCAAYATKTAAAAGCAVCGYADPDAIDDVSTAPHANRRDPGARVYLTVLVTSSEES